MAPQSVEASSDYTFRGPWFSAREAQLYVTCKTIGAWYAWRKRHGIVSRANGSVAKRDLDRVLNRVRPKRVPSPAQLANLRHQKVG